MARIVLGGHGRRRTTIRWPDVMYARSMANSSAAMVLHRVADGSVSCGAALHHEWIGCGEVDGIVVKLSHCVIVINETHLTEWEETGAGLVHLRFGDAAELSLHPETVSRAMLDNLPREMKRHRVLPSSDDDE